MAGGSRRRAAVDRAVPFLPAFVPEIGAFAMIGIVAGALLILLWWMFFSRAPWSERLGALALMIVALVATSRIVHESIANGMMGMMLVILGVPVQTAALVAWAVATRRLPDGLRRASMVVAIQLAGIWRVRPAVVRWDHRRRNVGSHVAMETQSPEERLLAEARDEPVAIPPAPALETPTKPVQPERRHEAAPPQPARTSGSLPRERGCENRGGGAGVAHDCGDRGTCGGVVGLSWSESRRSRPGGPGSTLTGLSLHPFSCGAGRLGPDGRPSRFMETCSIRRSSEVTTKSPPPTR